MDQIDLEQFCSRDRSEDKTTQWRQGVVRDFLKSLPLLRKKGWWGVNLDLKPISKFKPVGAIKEQSILARERRIAQEVEAILDRMGHLIDQASARGEFKARLDDENALCESLEIAANELAIHGYKVEINYKVILVTWDK